MDKDTFTRYIRALGFNAKLDAPAYKSTMYNGNTIDYDRDVSTYYFDETVCIQVDRKTGISHSVLSPFDNYRATFFYAGASSGSVIHRDLETINSLDDVVSLVDMVMGIYTTNNHRYSMYKDYKRTTLVTLKRDIKISELIG